MTTDLSHTWISPSQSPCSDPNSKLLCWERCVKRKYNDGSGQLLEGHNMAKTEGGNCSFSCDAMWCTMPNISHCQKTSITLRTRSNIVSLQDKQRDKSPLNSHLSVSNVGVFPHNRHLNVENETSYPLASTDHPLRPPYIQTDNKDVVSKKRIHMAMSVETLHRSVQACDKATADNEVFRLKEALKFEKIALRKLYRDLEEERCASTTAANEAMAMIRRLQEERAAALAESRQYKRASEEREAYNQEAIALLTDALSIKEHELFSLQDHIENYRNVLRKMKSGQGLIQMIEGDHLEGGKENAQLLLLEGKETASCSLVESKYLQRDLDEDCEAGDRALGESMYWHQHPLEESPLEVRMGLANLQCENYRSDTVIEEQDLEDVSMSILARVARLEERFACLGQDEALDPESLVPRSMTEDISFLKQDTTLMALQNTELNNSNSAKLKTGFVDDNCEDQKCPVFERATTNSEHGNQEHCYSAPIEERESKLNEMKLKEHSIGLHKASDNEERSYLEIRDSSSEAVHDVYEVPCELDCSAMPYLDLINGSYESGFGGRDFLLIDSMKALENEMVDGSTSVYGRHLPSYDDVAASMNDKLAAEISSAGVKNSVAATDLQHLKVRLQALEGERAFMKEAIEALRKENMELKLLQEIAHQLQELKGSGRHDQLPFLSFFKRILSFAGIQSLACTERRRFFYGCQGSSQTSSNKQEHGGLLHLLNNSFREEKSVCVTRKRKVKLDKT